MINRLIAFGDSWTHGHGVETDPAYKEIGRADDFVFQLRMCNSWPRWLADLLGIPFCNFGYPGSDNVNIKNCISMFHQRFLPDDLIIVMLSFPYRHTFRPEYRDITLRETIVNIQQELSGLNYCLVNSFYPTFSDEPEIKTTLDLSRFLAVDITAADILADYEQTHDIGVWEYGSRKVCGDVENFKAGDYHPNLAGYRVIANWLYDLLVEWEMVDQDPGFLYNNKM